MTIIKDVDIITTEQTLSSYDIKFKKLIEKIESDIKPGKEEKIIDGRDKFLVPGFIDLHLHGSFGIDLINATKKEIRDLTNLLKKEGTTSYLPTLITESKQKLEDVVGKISSIEEEAILGINLEGPLLNPEKIGAQSKEYIKRLDDDFFIRHKDIIKIVTLAPEMEGAELLIKKLNELNIVAAMGHTDADYRQSIKAFDQGIRLVTHIFNAMRGIHHRDIGPAGAALLEDVSIELIADLIHLSLPMINLILKLKSYDQIILVSDAQPAALYNGDPVRFNNKRVYIDQGSARYKDGTLAGSTLSMLKAVKNLKNNTKLNLTDIIKMATVNPAKMLNLDTRIGSIKEGMISDLLLLDRDLNIIEVFKRGEIVN